MSVENQLNHHHQYFINLKQYFDTVKGWNIYSHTIHSVETSDTKKERASVRIKVVAPVPSAEQIDNQSSSRSRPDSTTRILGQYDQTRRFGHTAPPTPSFSKTSQWYTLTEQVIRSTNWRSYHSVRTFLYLRVAYTSSSTTSWAV